MSEDIMEPGTHVEVRVASLESDVRAINRSVTELAGAVRDQGQLIREQGDKTERQIQELLGGLATAKAPKETNWQTLIAALSLIAVFLGGVYLLLDGKIYQNKVDQLATEVRAKESDRDILEMIKSSEDRSVTRDQEAAARHALKDEDFSRRLERVHDEMVAHEKLDGHTVTVMRQDMQEKATLALDVKLQKEFEVATKNTVTLIAAQDERLQKEFTLNKERDESRLSKLESQNTFITQSELAELFQRRLDDARAARPTPKK